MTAVQEKRCACCARLRPLAEFFLITRADGARYSANCQRCHSTGRVLNGYRTGSPNDPIDYSKTGSMKAVQGKQSDAGREFSGSGRCSCGGDMSLSKCKACGRYEARA